LEELGLIDANFAKRMAHLAYYRNDLVHLYREADVTKLSSVMHSEIKAVITFQKLILKWERMYHKTTTISQITQGKGVVAVLQSLFQ
jgi:uncharacterized protein YutE (UPF0331/DUF86 family)